MNVRITTVLNWISFMPVVMFFVITGMFFSDTEFCIGYIVLPGVVISLINLLLALRLKRSGATFFALILFHLNFFLLLFLTFSAHPS